MKGTLVGNYDPGVFLRPPATCFETGFTPGSYIMKTVRGRLIIDHQIKENRNEKEF
jgi:hypothetical protein